MPLLDLDPDLLAAVLGRVDCPFFAALASPRLRGPDGWRRVGPRHLTRSYERYRLLRRLPPHKFRDKQLARWAASQGQTAILAELWPGGHNCDSVCSAAAENDHWATLACALKMGWRSNAAIDEYWRAHGGAVTRQAVQEFTWDEPYQLTVEEALDRSVTSRILGQGQNVSCAVTLARSVELTRWFDAYTNMRAEGDLWLRVGPLRMPVTRATVVVVAALPFEVVFLEATGPVTADGLMLRERDRMVREIGRSGDLLYIGGMGYWVGSDPILYRPYQFTSQELRMPDLAAMALLEERRG